MSDQQPEGQQPEEQQYPSAYQQQELTEQVVVERGRPWWPVVTAVVLVLALVAGGVAWWLVRQHDGEETRAAYCRELRQLTAQQSIVQLFGDPQRLGDALEKVRRLAPGSVSGAWEDLVKQLQTQPSGGDAMDRSRAIVDDLRTLADDASGKCGLDLSLLPGSG